jgi:hypothetical protein
MAALKHFQNKAHYTHISEVLVPHPHQLPLTHILGYLRELNFQFQSLCPFSSLPSLSDGQFLLKHKQPSVKHYNG